MIIKQWTQLMKSSSSSSSSQELKKEMNKFLNKINIEIHNMKEIGKWKEENQIYAKVIQTTLIWPYSSSEYQCKVREGKVLLIRDRSQTNLDYQSNQLSFVFQEDLETYIHYGTFSVTRDHSLLLNPHANHSV